MEQQPSNKNMDNKPMEAEQVKKTRGRPKKAKQPTEKTPKEEKAPKEAKPKEAKPKAEKRPKETKPKAQPKAENKPTEQPAETKPTEQPAETKPKKDKHLKLESEEKELLHAQLKLKQFREAERQYKEALQGLSKKKP